MVTAPRPPDLTAEPRLTAARAENIFTPCHPLLWGTPDTDTILQSYISILKIFKLKTIKIFFFSFILVILPNRVIVSIIVKSTVWQQKLAI